MGLYNVDETMADSTWADGYGRWHALVALSGDSRTDAAKARTLILDELVARSARGARPVFDVTLVRETEHGTAIYAETDTDDKP